MPREHAPRASSGFGGWLLVGLFTPMIVGLVVTFLVVVEGPRRARNAAIELIRTRFQGGVETVSGSPGWLVGTFAEDYFTYVVTLRVAHGEPPRPGEANYLAALPHLDRLEIDLPRGGSSIVEALPYSPDLVELKLANAVGLPDPADVPNLTDLVLLNPVWQPHDALVLADFEKLERVTLLIRDPEVTRQAIVAVSRLPRLVELRLEFSDVADDALVPLSRSRSLRLLDLTRTGIGPEALRDVAAIASLQHLELDNNFVGRHVQLGGHGVSREAPANTIDDEALAHVAKLPDLRFLQLDRTAVGDAGMQHVARLPVLQFLYLENTKVGNAGVEHLADLRHLKRLNLRKSWYAEGVIDDAAVDSLVSLKKLEVLGLYYTDISREGLARLMLELPSTRIDPLRPRPQPSPLKAEQLERAKRDQ